MLRPYALVLVLATFAAAPAAGDEPVDFDHDVRPIISRRCFVCHGPDESTRKADLRLDIPTDFDLDVVIERVTATDPAERMPRGAPPLTAEEIEVLRRWIEGGAPYEHHWSWLPIEEVDPPEVSDPSWPRDPLDRFVLAQLEREGLEPAPEATRPTIIRRLSLTLLGLPPTPEEVDAFVRDRRPDAYERLVDRLLASPHFGERWARHWLDLVRYAETYGHEFDYPNHHAWQYRDYVIRAFNEDVPYDDLLREHVAGDLLPEPRRHPIEGYNESILGTGFWWLSQGTHGPVDVRGDEAERVDNQIDVLSKTFLATTVACARCHDHKFDAISTADYYALYGFLQSSRRQVAYVDPGGRIAAAAAELGEIADAFGPLATAAMPSPDEVEALVAEALDPAAEPIVFDDFEDGDLDGWTIDGTAFGPASQTQETIGPWQGEVDAVGTGFINSHNVRNGEDVRAADAHTGRMRSDPFTIERRFIQFRIGGGNHAGRTCVNLLVDGEVVRTAVGHNSNRMRGERWPVSDLLGREAQLEVVDEETGGWGNIGLDHIVFSDHPGELPAPMSFPDDVVLFEDFSGATFNGWRATGWAFDRPVRAGEIRDDGERLHVATESSADSGRLSSYLQGTLRSRTFEIAFDALFVRARGHGVVRIIIDGFHLDEFNPLLFENAMVRIDDDAWRVYRINAHRYHGHRAYLEIIDDGDRALVVDFIASGSAPGTFDQSHVREAWLLDNGVLDLEARLPGLAAYRSRHAELTADLPAPSRALAMADGSGEDEYIFIRGSYRTPGEVVPRRFVESLADEQAPIEEGSGRLVLAERMLDPRNPLPARVWVNRVWHHLLGRGIVPTTDDFGALGQLPTHPELLDHLAAWLRNEADWSTRALIRRIVLTSTYRMASVHPDPVAAEVDPTNTLLHRMHVKRLEGEALRDTILSVSGRLDPTMFGPPVDIHLTPFMQGRGRPGNSGPLDGNGRRSIYIAVRRNFLSPMMLAFDTPVPSSTFGRRNRSNVPAQSLILMNDPFVVEQARLWARRVLEAEPEGVDRRIDLVYRAALSRPPTAEERSLAREFLRAQARLMGLEPNAWRSHEDVWADYCHVVLNLKEFVFVH